MRLIIGVLIWLTILIVPFVLLCREIGFLQCMGIVAIGIVASVLLQLATWLVTGV